jgi:hypothetical protein
MFSDALLEVLRKGDPHLGSRFSINELGGLVRLQLATMHPADWVRPEVHSPDQREGDVADVPLFPNPSYESPETVERLTNDNHYYAWRGLQQKLFFVSQVLLRHSNLLVATALTVTLLLDCFRKLSKTLDPLQLTFAIIAIILLSSSAILVHMRLSQRKPHTRSYQILPWIMVFLLFASFHAPGITFAFQSLLIESTMATTHTGMRPVRIVLNDVTKDIWIANEKDHSLTRITPSSGLQQTVRPSIHWPFDMVFDNEDNIWVSNQYNPYMDKADPLDNTVSQSA